MREAVVLAGGLGTRLRSVLPDTPKALAPIQGRPFLDYLLDYLASQHVEHVCLALGYRAEKILERYRSNSPLPPHSAGFLPQVGQWKGLRLSASIETEPLGTGGALAQALPHLQAPRLFVLNGDTFFPIPLQDMEELHTQRSRPLTLALAYVSPADRYGLVEVQDGFILAFREKEPRPAGWIYGGIALIEATWWQAQTWPERFSWELYLKETAPTLRPSAYLAQNVPFLDIGVPADYEKAQTFLPRYGSI
ncbi:MAG: D-mannose-1-phosphate guanyltransferase [Bacteroidetes bacterium]|nr:MAG: D-mannose-1-phosphate guanyltransferase [Bacteroidota bacterium]